MTEHRKSNIKTWLAPLPEDPGELFLVGGAVRDRLLGRTSADVDLLCRDAKGLAAKLAATRNATVVAFEKKPGEPCYRVVDRSDPDDHLDLAAMRGGDILSDLAQRDFTINAMAMPIVKGQVAGEILDPFQGKKDLAARRIRMTSPRVFVQDPLRMVRAFRFAAELGFGMEQQTFATIQKEAWRLRETAAERILAELLRVYRSARSASVTSLMLNGGLLEVVFPEIKPMKGCPQNAYHHKDVWEHSLLVLETCERMLGRLDDFLGPVRDCVRENLGRRNRLPILKLSALLHDMGKPSTRAVNQETGRITFYGHDARGEEMAHDIGQRLKMSLEDRELFKLLVREHLHVLNLSNPDLQRPTRMRWFRRLKDDAIPVILLGMADRQGTLGPASSPGDLSLHLQWSREAIIQYYQSIKQELERKDFLSGRDFIQWGMKPGPEMGKLLRAVREAQDAGTVRDRAEALTLARSLLDQPI